MKPAAKYEALRTAVACMRDGQPVPEPAASWLAEGFAWYLEHEGESLDAALLLTVASGGAHTTIWRACRYAKRNQLLHDLAASVGGVTWKAAEQIAAMLQHVDRTGCIEAPTADQRLALGLLVLLDPPRSVSQIWRALSETRHLHETPAYSQVDREGL